MKWNAFIVTTIVLLLGAVGCSRDKESAKSSASDSSSSDNTEWIVAQFSSSNSSLGIVRHMATKPKCWKELPLSEEVSLSWNFEGSLPDGETQNKMNELEDALEPLSSGPNSFMVLVITIDGMREWCFYTDDYDFFMERLNSLLAEKPHFPISIVHSHDPEWQYWHVFVDKLREKQN